MSRHIPTPPEEKEAPIAPDHATGSFTNCDCSDCREKRLLDDRNHLYTPHDMTDAWAEGWKAGFSRGEKARKGAKTAHG